MFFVQYVVCDQGRDWVRHEGKGKGEDSMFGDIQQKWEAQNFGHDGRAVQSILLREI